ncbi:MAG: glycoside hydrolase family 15 protein [Gammaproteobacteria bacterium]|nr:glycoside hydrolase family 15 protein [Gammaproteobacteria bacterium]
MPNEPGSTATWSTAAKDGVGCGLSSSRLWFTLAEGIVTEVYYPRIDIPQLKDLGFLIADNEGFWVEIRRLGHYRVVWQDTCVPAFTITHHHERFTFILQICTDPCRDVLLIHYSLIGDPSLFVHVLAAPRLGEDAAHMRAQTAEWNGRQVLWAEQGPFGMALAVRTDDDRCVFAARSVGVVGESDLWQDFARHGSMTWNHTDAGPAEVTLGARLAHPAGTLALGLGTSKETAATLAYATLHEGFPRVLSQYVAGWQAWHRTLRVPPLVENLPVSVTHLFHRSATIIKVHIDHTVPGAMVASLSVPWGESSNSRAGYHLVWPRDLVESAGALVALGALDEARQVLVYLMATQQSDGHWLQNQWLGGKPFWQGVQLDETGFPVILAGLLEDHGALQGMSVIDMVRRALTFLLREGPVTPQDRWEEDAGINTFTMAIMIAALTEGARFLPEKERRCALLVADYWNSHLENWTCVHNTTLSQALRIPCYYVRIAPANTLCGEDIREQPLPIKNHRYHAAPGAGEQIAVDFLQLCRYGLRQPDDPAVRSSLYAADALLKVETPSGPVWHRYNGDGYGEHHDGRPFDGSGHGRGWPLLTGERGHYALLAGEDPLPYLETLSRMVGRGGLLPEQVWDAAAINARHLHPGRPTGSAMPLVWAHAELIKLTLSIAAGRIVDMPTQTQARYRGTRATVDYVIWQYPNPVLEIPAGLDLYLLLPRPATVHIGFDGWLDPTDVQSEDHGLAHLVHLPQSHLYRARLLDFTLLWHDTGQWEGRDWHLRIRETASA